MKKTTLLLISLCVLIPLTTIAQNTGEKILLPVEVMGAQGTIEEIDLTLTSDQATKADLLWLQINNVGYEDKISIKINDETWLDLNHSTTKIQSPERERGGMAHGGHSTIRLTIPSSGIAAGVNNIKFRFNMSDAISSGFRIVKLNLLDISSANILDDSFFEDDDPLVWKSPYYDEMNEKEPDDLFSKVAQGKDLWYNADLVSNYFEPGQSGFWYGHDTGGAAPIKAKCASCHTQDGRDLEIFSYSNKSIIERSRFHMLTEEEGKLIATYIRSLSEEHDNVGRYGRPWNPPYQPGPELEGKPIEEWAAGAGLDAVLQADKDMLPHMFPNGVDQEKVYDRFDSEKMVDRTLLPLAIQFPDWKHWLPMIHPMDAYSKDDYWEDPTIFGNNRNSIHPKEQYKEFRAYLEAMPPANRDPAELMEENRDFWYDYRFFLAQRNDGATTLDGHWREENSMATDHLGVGVPREFAATSLARLMGVQYFEIMNEFDLQDKAHWFAKPEDQPAERQWFGTMYQIFEIPAHFQACVPDEANGIKGQCWNFYGQPQNVGEYESTNWYHLQLIVNGGNGMVSHNSPVDYNYHPTFILRASSSSGIYEPLRYYHSMNALYQFRSWSGATNPNDGKGFRIRVQGPWHIIGRTDSNQLHDFAESIWPTFLDRVKPGMSKWVLNAQLRQFLNEVRKPENDLNNWNRLPNGGSNELDAISKTTAQLKDMSEYTGLDFWADKFYYLFPEFSKLGVDCQILEEMIDWCEEAWPNIDWNIFRKKGELQLDLLAELGEDCSVNSTMLTAQTTNEGDSPIYEWWVDGEKLINKLNTLDTSELRQGAIVKCRVTSSKTCISNGWIESELTLPSDGFVIKSRKNGGNWEELENSFACIDDTVEFKIDPELQEPLFWLDAMDINNDASEPSGGSDVTTWVNKSVSGYTMPNQSNSSLRPTYNSTGMNGLPALMFGTNDADGLELFPTSNDDYLNEDWTMIIVGSYKRRGSWNAITGNEDGDSGFATYFEGSHGRTRTKMNGTQEHGRYYEDETDFVLMISKEGKNLKTYLNGKLEVEVTASSGNITNSRAFYLGQRNGGSTSAGWYHKGPISEVLFYDYMISNTQKNYVEGYLMHKWNFHNEIPADHVYKEYSPLYMNLETPEGESLVFDKNININSIALNTTENFGDFMFTRPSCPETNRTVTISNSGNLGSDLVKYSIDNSKFKIGYDITIYEEEALELVPNYEFNGDYQWEDPDGNLLALNTNPTKFSVTIANDQQIWSLKVLQDVGSCISSDMEFPVTLTVTAIPESEKDDDLDGVTNDIDQCPNTTSGALVNEVGCFDLPVNNFTIEAVGETCVGSKNGSISINAGATYTYTATVDDANEYNFTNDLIIENLDPGTYSICIIVAEAPSYEQCFNLTIEAAEEIIGKSVKVKNGNVITENVEITSGTPPYTILVNGINMLTTYSNNFSIDVNHGDRISVSTKFECEGLFMNYVDLSDHFDVYPNPTSDIVTISVPMIDVNDISVSVYNSLNQKVIDKNCKVQGGSIETSLKDLPNGIYFLKLNLETPVNLKIVKK